MWWCIKLRSTLQVKVQLIIWYLLLSVKSSQDCSVSFERQCRRCGLSTPEMPPLISLCPVPKGRVTNWVYPLLPGDIPFLKKKKTALQCLRYAPLIPGWGCAGIYIDWCIKQTLETKLVHCGHTWQIHVFLHKCVSWYYIQQLCFDMFSAKEKSRVISRYFVHILTFKINHFNYTKCQLVH